MGCATVKHISDCFIKPKYDVEEANKPYYLAPMDLLMLSCHYNQKGLLFKKPSHFDDGQQFSIHKLLERLKDSLSLTLVHFYPLAGQLATRVVESQHKSVVYVDCNKGPGARFIHATLDMTISDILSPTYVSKQTTHPNSIKVESGEGKTYASHVPFVVQSLFDHNRAICHDGHFMSLLTIQVTELIDGIFIGCSMNHVLGDGTSYWNFWNVWSEIHRKNNDEYVCTSNLPIHKRWFPNGYDPPIFLPYTHPNEFVTRYEAPPLREMIFHFSTKSIATLKAKANEEKNKNKTNVISSFQALSALCWRAIVRANCLPKDQITNCRLAVNNRRRLDPPLPTNYFGNCMNAMTASTTVGELLKHDNLWWAASLLHQLVVKHDHKRVMDFVYEWVKSPYIYNMREMFDPYSVMMAGSPRFDIYGNEFGFGKAVAVRSGYANKYVGKVTSYEGCEGKGSVDLEICLSPGSMKTLESDEEFMSAMIVQL